MSEIYDTTGAGAMKTNVYKIFRGIKRFDIPLLNICQARNEIVKWFSYHQAAM